MVLIDTSVWVDHLRSGNKELQGLLNEGLVLCHTFVIAELACGNLKNRSEVLSLLQALPRATEAEPQEVLRFVENYRLMGRGLGYIDVHLLVSAALSGVPLWTLDKKLADAASKIGLAY